MVGVTGGRGVGVTGGKGVDVTGGRGVGMVQSFAWNSPRGHGEQQVLNSRNCHFSHDKHLDAQTHSITLTLCFFIESNGLHSIDCRP